MTSTGGQGAPNQLVFRSFLQCLKTWRLRVSSTSWHAHAAYQHFQGQHHGAWFLKSFSQLIHRSLQLKMLKPTNQQDGRLLSWTLTCRLGNQPTAVSWLARQFFPSCRTTCTYMTTTANASIFFAIHETQRQTQRPHKQFETSHQDSEHVS